MSNDEKKKSKRVSFYKELAEPKPNDPEAERKKQEILERLRHATKKPKYRVEYAQMLYVHLKSGKPFQSFAAKVFVNPSTINVWVDTYEEFALAKSLGELEAYELFSEACKVKALKASTNYDPQMLKFILETRFARIGQFATEKEFDSLEPLKEIKFAYREPEKREN